MPTVNPDRVPSHSRAFMYPLQVWYLLGAFLALVSLCHIGLLLVCRLGSPTHYATPARSRPQTLHRRTPLAIWNFVRNLAFRTTLSIGNVYTVNLTELFLGCAYTAVLFTWALINTTTLAGIPLSPQYYANRSALIAATQLPLVVALGMKNNIITLLTGIGFDKLNILHRVAARVLCVLLWLHASGHILESGRAGTISNLQETWFRCGLLAISSLSLLTISSLKPLRSRGYELFLVSHFFAVLIFLGGAYYHVNNFGLAYFILPSVLLWALDRLIRVIRVFFVNGGSSALLRSASSSAPYLKLQATAKVSVISPQLLRVTVWCPTAFRWAPGQLVYLSIPTVSLAPWEAHPFTIASIDGEIPPKAPVDSERASDGDSDPEKELSSPVESVATDPTIPTRYAKNKRLVFIIRVRNGFTRRLLHSAASSGLNAYIDGPYCSPPSTRGFSTVLLICGGSGISFTWALFLDAIRATNLGIDLVHRKLILVWAIRDLELLNSISDELLQVLRNAPDALAVDVAIHTTRVAASYNESDEEKSNSSAHTGSDSSPTKLLEAAGVRVQRGRPNIGEIVNTAAAETAGAMSVNVCGTAAMAGDVRRAARAASSGSNILKGGASISLHVEAFGG